MSVPWHSDFLQCAAERVDGGLDVLPWWPAQRPIDVRETDFGDALKWIRSFYHPGEMTLRELGQLADPAGDRQPVDRVPTDVLEHRPREVAHVEQRLGLEPVQRGDGGLAGRPGRAGDVRVPGRRTTWSSPWI